MARNAETMGEKIRVQRALHGHSLRELAEIANAYGASTNKDELSRIESGRYTEETVDPFVVLTIARVYDTTVRELSSRVSDRLEAIEALLVASQNWKELSRNAANGKFTTPQARPDAA